MLSIIQKPLKKTEFVLLMACLTAIMPLAIDSMLPAFSEIAGEFGVTSPENIQLIVAVLFLGFGFGQLVFGPLGDVFGRKSPIYVGVFIFIVGSILSGFANSFEVFLTGRVLQGFGGASTRVISTALIRDQYSGDAMAEITSLVMTIFILMPAIAPSLGQGILYFWSWRAIFVALFLWGTLSLLWFTFRQQETLAKEKRRSLKVKEVLWGFKEVFAQPTTIFCIISLGCLFGVFVGYLGAVENIFTNIFHVGPQFPIFFGILALSVGVASFLNSRVVKKFGMRNLLKIGFLWMLVLSILFVLYLYLFNVQHPSLWVFMIYMMGCFFSVGFLFGNLNALAMQPLGHIAGIGSSIIGFFQMNMSVVIGVQLGKYYHDNVAPIALSFAAVALIGLLLFQLESFLCHRRTLVKRGE